MGTLDPESLDRGNNLAAALFRLERSRTPEDLRRLVVSFDRWFAAEERKPLRRSFARWLTRLLRHRSPGDSIPEVADVLEMDVESMLAERIESWAQELEQKGRAQGLERGMEKGRLEGEAQLLRRQLQRRYVGLPDWVEAKLGAATEEELIRWGEEMLNAPALDQLFAR